MRSLRTTMKSSPCSPQLEKARAQERRPNAAKKKERKKQTNKQTREVVDVFWKYQSETLSQFTFDILGQPYLTFLLFSLSTDPNSNSIFFCCKVMLFNSEIKDEVQTGEQKWICPRVTFVRVERAK